MVIDHDVIDSSYEFAIFTDGQVYGLINGDMGYEETGIFIDEVSVDIFKAGLRVIDASNKNESKQTIP